MIGEVGAVVGTSGGDDSSSKDDASRGGAPSSSNLEVKFLNSLENQPKWAEPGKPGKPARRQAGQTSVAWLKRKRAG